MIEYEMIHSAFVEGYEKEKSDKQIEEEALGQKFKCKPFS